LTGMNSYRRSENNPVTRRACHRVDRVRPR
jgi:hypothetical protein